MIKFKMEPVAQQSSEQQIAGGLASIVSDDPPQKIVQKKYKMSPFMNVSQKVVLLS